MTKIDDKYLIDNFDFYTQREFAEHFGVSVSTIARHVAKLGLKRNKTQKNAKTRQVAAKQKTVLKKSSDELARLRELRDILYEELIKTTGSTVAKISKEYREVLAVIRVMEGGGEDKKQTGAFAELAEAIVRGVSNPNV